MLHIAMFLILAASAVTYGKILSSENTTIEEYPYHILVEYENFASCGGSLIRPNVALTSPYCAYNAFTDTVAVRAGTTIRREGGIVVNVSKICDYTEFSDAHFDVTVLKLSKSFNLSNTVNIIPLQDLNEEVPTGTLATFTGWGGLGASITETVYKNLQKVQVPKVDLKQCQKDYFPYPVNDSIICFGFPKGGDDVCNGDVGGPIVANGKQVGIISRSLPCAHRGKAGMYTRIASKKIHDHINKCLEEFQ